MNRPVGGVLRFNDATAGVARVGAGRPLLALNLVAGADGLADLSDIRAADANCASTAPLFPVASEGDG